jgi:tetratricopeptide (TPR) repeat protein
MKKTVFAAITMFIVFGVIFLFTGCQDTFVTSAKVYMQQSNYDKAIEQCLLAVEQIPNNYEAYFVLGKAYSEKNMYREMNDAFNKCSTINQSHTADIQNYKENYYRNIFSDGVRKYNEKNFDEAAQKFQLATEILPKRMEGYKNLAITYTQMKRDSEAVETYKRALAADSTDLDSWTSLGILHYRDKKYGPCISTLKTVLAKANPQSKQYADALYYTAYSYDLLGQTDDALATYQKALEQSPNDLDLIFNLGRLYYMQSKYDKAIEYFQKVLQSNPDDFDTNVDIGNSYIQIKKFKEALPYLEKATQLKPDNSQAWYNLAVVWVNLGNRVKGQEALDKAESLKKNEE